MAKKKDNPAGEMHDTYADTLIQLYEDLVTLRKEIKHLGDKRLVHYRKYFSYQTFTKSACNLAYYLAMRQHDLRHLQDRLAHAGLSSLGRAESSVIDTLDAIIEILKRATLPELRPKPECTIDHGFNRGQQLLEQHTIELFGPYFEANKTHVMVTLSVEAARDYNLVFSLLKKGMTCARINCAHDIETVWLDIIANIRRAETETGHSCRIMMDLAGHKIRTGPIALEPPVHHIKVTRDRTGSIIAPGYLVLSLVGSTPTAHQNLFIVPINPVLHSKLMTGISLEFIDEQKRLRYIKVEKNLSSTEWLVSCHEDAYLASASEVYLCRQHDANANANTKKLEKNKFKLGNFAGEPAKIKLEKDDLLLLTRDKIEGQPAQYSTSGELVRPAHISCTLPSALDYLQPGQAVWLDDGKIGAVIEKINDQGALLRITAAKTGGVRLHADRGINFPNTDLKLPALSKKDIKDLNFICSHADLIGFSFVETMADIEALMKILAKHNAPDLPIIAKIETDTAVKNLPDIILGCIGRHKLGIMIARGDLAVELGSVRLAEIQEEILWLCEAAHVPVIWATQVLESVAKKGTRSRPEFTDAAMAVRAECVMLNKGPFIVDAIVALVEVINKMQDHQRKKFSRLRALHW